MKLKSLAFNAMLSMGFRIERYKNNWQLDTGSHSFQPDPNIGMDIKNFFSNIDPFYENIKDLPKELQIGAWKIQLENRRKNQVTVYKRGNSADIAELHENMFYNELITGLWAYFYFDKITKSGIADFSDDFKDYDRIYPDHPYLLTDNPIKCWGHRNSSVENNKLIKNSDIAHAIEALMVTNCANLISNDSCTVLEIGSGMGGLAERLYHSKKISKLILFDIPLNLVTAYYYLKRGLGEKSNILMASTREEAIKGLTSKEVEICLLPTCFFPCLSNEMEIDIVSNFYSFSEMYEDTVNYYLNNLPESVRIICQANSNTAVLKNDNHTTEVSCDRFDYPKGFVEVFSSIQMPLKSCKSRYKSKILYKN